MKSALLLIAGLLIFSTLSVSGHISMVVKKSDLPIDSLTKKELISALNGFLIQKEKPISQNQYILKEDKLEMSALVDEMKGMDKNKKLKDDNFYRADLTNIVDLNDNTFLVQVSYMGISEKLPVLRASFNLLAKKVDTQFYFFSPLKQNTGTWKTKKLSNITYHFKDTLDNANAKLFLKTVNSYDKRLNTPVTPFDFYFCDNSPEAMLLLGVEYKSDYQGIKYVDISSHDNNSNLEINAGYNGILRLDLHDLWHDRLHRVVSLEIIDRPVDEGCAYLYGGSWGLGWREILRLFKKYATEHPDADWQKLYTDNINLTDDGVKSLKIAYAINALIVQKIEKEKGFAPILELISCGKREPGDDNYFKALEKVSRITKAGFNDAVWGLIRGAN
ncbi:MAG: hypothetical protein ACHQIM_22975 [Sphingobacteriales bacterium]